MRSNLLLLVTIFLLHFSSTSQVKSDKADITLGPELKESRLSTLGDVIGSDDSGVYTLKIRRKGLYGLNSTIEIEHLNRKMVQTKSAELKLGEGKMEKAYEFTIEQNNEMYLFSSLRDQRSKTKSLYVQTINKNSLEFNNDLRKVSEIDYSGKTKLNSGAYNYIVSADSSKTLIYHRLPFDRGEYEKFKLQVLDENLNNLWTKEITLPYSQELFYIEDYILDQFGNVHLVGRLYKEKLTRKKRGNPNYSYLLLSYSHETNKLSEQEIKLENKFITEMKVEVNSHEEIICAGFYSDFGTTSIKGTYFLKIGLEEKNVLTREMVDFEFDFITQNMSQREESKAKRKAEKGKEVEMFEYQLDDLILREDGGVMLIGEQFFIRESVSYTTNAQGQVDSRITYHYYFNDIIVVNISSNGEIKWTQKIPKRQRTVDDDGFFSSYSLAVCDDMLYFVFNDNPKNLFYVGEGPLYNFTKSKESIAVVVSLDEEGIQTREALFSTREADILARAKVSEQISKNQMVLYGQRKKTHRYALLTFKD